MDRGWACRGLWALGLHYGNRQELGRQLGRTGTFQGESQTSFSAWGMQGLEEAYHFLSSHQWFVHISVTVLQVSKFRLLQVR